MCLEKAEISYYLKHRVKIHLGLSKLSSHLVEVMERCD
jgi:hypothetical protein